MPRLPALSAILAALLVPASLTAKSPPPAPDSALAEGQIIPAGDGTTVGGWRRIYGGTYAKRNYAAGSDSETYECCFSLFEKGKALLVLRTEAVTRDSGGKVLTERILRKRWVTRRASEQVTDCQILWISPQLSLFDVKTEMIRSVVIENGEFTLIEWRDPGSGCSFGD